MVGGVMGLEMTQKRLYRSIEEGITLYNGEVCAVNKKEERNFSSETEQ